MYFLERDELSSLKGKNILWQSTLAAKVTGSKQGKKTLLGNPVYTAVYTGRKSDKKCYQLSLHHTVKDVG
jgi:hypothetical protein